MNYLEKLKDPRWQKKRLFTLDRDSWKCKNCDTAERALNVHHLYYLKDIDPWDYPDAALVTLCGLCHEEWHGLKQLLDQASPYLIVELEWLIQCAKYGPRRQIEDSFEKNIKTIGPVLDWVAVRAIQADNDYSSVIVDCCLLIKEHAYKFKPGGLNAN